DPFELSANPTFHFLTNPAGGACCTSENPGDVIQQRIARLHKPPRSQRPPKRNLVGTLGWLDLSPQAGKSYNALAPRGAPDGIRFYVSCPEFPPVRSDRPGDRTAGHSLVCPGLRRRADRCLDLLSQAGRILAGQDQQAGFRRLPSLGDAWRCPGRTSWLRPFLQLPLLPR